MPLPPGWVADLAIAARPLLPWEGTVWRGHSPRYGATDHGGSLRITGRWHRAANQFPSDQTWPALYTDLALHVCLGEVLRNSADDRVRRFRYSELRVRLGAVLDCRDATVFGLEDGAFLDNLDFHATHALAEAARRLGAEALLVQSASLLGNNLVIFPDRLAEGSLVEESRFLDPRLVKRR